MSKIKKKYDWDRSWGNIVVALFATVIFFFGMWAASSFSMWIASWALPMLSVHLGSMIVASVFAFAIFLFSIYSMSNDNKGSY